MTDQNKLNKFWHELKRRKVVRVTIIYATTVFILLQLIDLIREPLHLPDWVATFFVVLLLAGFPIVVILAWIFDVTPQGIEVTPAVDQKTEPPKTKNSRSREIILDTTIGILLVIVMILAWPKIFKPDKKSIGPETEKSIAVLPFVDDSPEKGNAYIINGLMDEILNKLQKIKELKVKSRTSVEIYRDQKKSVEDISKELNAKYILEGSGLKIGNKIKITLQLIEGETGNHLWSNPYLEEVDENDLEGIFNIIEDVSFSVARELKAVITPEEEKNIKTNPTEDKEAWDLYLKGRDKWNRYLISTGELDLLEEAKSDLTEAIIRDPKFAMAYAELGMVYVVLAHSSALPPKEYWGSAIKMLKQSIEIDHNSGYAYTYMGITETLFNHDSLAAINSYKRALQLMPNEMQVYLDLCFYHSRLGNCSELKRYMDILADKFNRINIFNELDMYNLKWLTCEGNHLKIIELEKENQRKGDKYTATLLATHMIINAFIQVNNFDRALFYADLCISQIDDPVYGKANKAIVLAMKGDSDSTHNILSELKEVSNYRYVSPTLLAAIHAALGDKAKALEFLEQAIADRDWRLMDMFDYAPFYQQRNAPWLQDIIKKMWTPVHEEALSQ